MVTVKIRTNDTKWAQRLGLHFQDEGKGDGYGIATVEVLAVEKLTFAGRGMVRFDLGGDLPRDYPNRWVMVPAANLT